MQERGQGENESPMGAVDSGAKVVQVTSGPSSRRPASAFLSREWSAGVIHVRPDVAISFLSLLNFRFIAVL
jgi:hypothetical protein